MQQNGKDNSLAIGAGIVGGLAVVVGTVIALALAFWAFILTGVCAFVWMNDTPLKFGWMHITPYEAKKFILRGLAGAFLLPAFALFAVAMTGAGIVPDAWLYLVLGGYVAGSLGMDWLESQYEDLPSASPQMEVLPPQQQPPSLPAQKEPTHPWGPSIDVAEGGKPEQPPFRFASWDDEEELRK